MRLYVLLYSNKFQFSKNVSNVRLIGVVAYEFHLYSCSCSCSYFLFMLLLLFSFSIYLVPCYISLFIYLNRMWPSKFSLWHMNVYCHMNKPNIWTFYRPGYCDNPHDSILFHSLFSIKSTHNFQSHSTQQNTT